MDVLNAIITVLNEPIPPINLSDGDSSEDEEFFELLETRREDQQVHVRVQNYVVSTADRYSAVDFRSHFRLSRTAVQELLNVFGEDPINMFGRPSVSKRHALLMSLWLLGTLETFRSVADRFGFDRGHAHRIIFSIFRELNRKSYKWICWPTRDAARNRVEEFQSKGFPGVVGVVDGCHIPIPNPVHDNSYFNRKKFTSIILQGVCDRHLRFLDVFAGFPGSAHDARVWAESPLGRALQENWEVMLPMDCHLLGDKAYPSLNYLVVPFKDNGHLTHQMVRFNTRLSKVRVLIEHAYGRLKGIFTRLQKLNIKCVPYAQLYVIAACILHNIVIQERFELGDLVFQNQYQPGQEDDEVDYDDDDDVFFDHLLLENGAQKRIRLMNAIIT